MNVDKLTSICRYVGALLLVVSLIGGNVWGGTLWLVLLYVSCVLIGARVVYEMIHFKKYREHNISLLVMFPIIIIVILILDYFHVL